jgi:hypothetical protein
MSERPVAPEGARQMLRRNADNIGDAVQGQFVREAILDEPQRPLDRTR